MVRNDVTRHTRQALVLVGGMAGAIALSWFALRRGSFEVYLSLLIGWPVLTLLPAQLGQWLVANERLDGTIKFLKMLPISSAEVVGAKSLSAGAIVTTVFAIFWLLPFLVGRLFGATVSFFFLFVAFGLYVLALTIAAFCVCLNFIFDKAIVAVLPFVALVVLCVGGFALTNAVSLKYPTLWSLFAGSIAVQAAFGLGCLVVWGGALFALYTTAKRAYDSMPG